MTGQTETPRESINNYDDDAADPERQGKWLSVGIVIGYIVGTTMYIACFVIAFKMRSPEEWWLNLLLCFFGGAVGWTVGVLMSPATPTQDEKFTSYGKSLSAFVSGFVIAKLDILLKTFGVTADIVWMGRLLLFGTTFFLGFQFTFVARWTNRRRREVRASVAPDVAKGVSSAKPD